MIEEIVFHEGMQSVKHLSSGALKTKTFGA